MKFERIVIVPYLPDWPRQYEEERALLKTIFAGSDIAIEHVGSTAVPGLGGKPVIDIMVGLSELAEAECRIPELECAGYEYVREYETQLPKRQYFRKPRIGSRVFHLHCVIKPSDFWIRHLAFRDLLRAHPESAAAYYELKRDLAIRVKKEEYTEAKSPFIKAILTRVFGNNNPPPAQPAAGADR
jgi:GrpB-like predicted nucleotidyltransferase (UPF0157 family)